MTSGLFELMSKGGPIMWFIFVGSVIAVGVIIERMIFFRRCSIRIDEFLKGISNLIKKKRYEEALERCDEAYGPAVRVIQTAIIKRDLPKNEVREIVQEVAQLQVPKLESNLLLLGTIGYISPLLGLLGTVTGMIEAFKKMNMAMGATPISDLAGGIWEALVTTAGGLVVAICCYVAYNFLNARLNSLITDMERSGIEVIQLLFDGDEKKVSDREQRNRGEKDKAGEVDKKNFTEGVNKEKGEKSSLEKTKKTENSQGKSEKKKELSSVK